MDLILVSIHCRYALDGVKGQREGFMQAFICGLYYIGLPSIVTH